MSQYAHEALARIANDLRSRYEPLETDVAKEEAVSNALSTEIATRQESGERQN
jgi:hypothetical protein